MFKRISRQNGIYVLKTDRTDYIFELSTTALIPEAGPTK